MSMSRPVLERCFIYKVSDVKKFTVSQPPTFQCLLDLSIVEQGRSLIFDGWTGLIELINDFVAYHLWDS